MKVEDIRGLTVAEKLRKVSEFAGIPADVLDRQWMVESTRGKKMIGEPVKVGNEIVRAEGHFQFIPKTRKAIAAKMGVADFDPYDFDQGVLAAGYLWKENMAAAKGDINVAAALYFAGPDRKQWGPLTDDYVKKVAQGKLPDTARQVQNASELGDPTAGLLTDDRLMAGFAAEGSKPVEVDPLYREQSLAAAVEAQDAAVAARQKEEAGKGSLWSTAFEDRTLRADFAILDALVRPGDEDTPADWDFASQLPDVAARLQVRDSELEILQEFGARGPAGLDYAVNRIMADREREATYAAYGPWEVFGAQMVSGAADPVGWSVGFGVFKAAHLMKVGSAALAAAARPGAAVASAAAEGAVGALAFEGILDGLGEQRTAADYLMAAGFGAGLGGALTARGAYRTAAEQATLKEFDTLVNRVYNEDFVGPLPPEEQAKRDQEMIRRELQKGQPGGDRVIPDEVNEEINKVENPEPEVEPIPVGESTEIDSPMPTMTKPAAMQGSNSFFQRLRAIAPILRLPGGIPEGYKWVQSDFVQGQADAHASSLEASRRYLDGDMDYSDIVRKPPGVYMSKKFQKDSVASPEVLALAESLRKRFLPDGKVTIGTYVSTPGAWGEVSSAGNVHFIGIKVDEDPKMQMRTLAHEMGHAILHQYLQKVDPDLILRMKTDHLNFLEAYAQDKVAARGMRMTMSHDGRLRGGINNVQGTTYPPSERDYPLPTAKQKPGLPNDLKQSQQARVNYITDFDEFGAEQFVKRFEKDVLKQADYIPDDVLDVLLTMLRRIVDYFKSIGANTQASPAESFDEFFTNAMNRVYADLDKLNELVQSGPEPEMLAPELVIPASAPVGKNPGAVIANKRRLAAKIVQSAEDFLRANPIDQDRINVLTARFGGALSDGLRLARSPSKVLQMVSALVTETTTQVRRGGDKRTVTMRAHTLKSNLMGDGLPRFQAAYESWRARNKGSVIEDLYAGAKRREFNRAVMLEILARREINYVPSPDRSVMSAADALEAGFERARKQQVDSNVLGAANLPTTGRGYVPQSLNGRVIAEIAPAERQMLEAHLGRRFAAVYGWDRGFAEDVARTYVTRERNRAMGGDQFPTSADDPASPIKESLEEMKRGASGPRLTQIQQAEVAFSDRGLGQTKARLDVGLTERLPNGKLVLDYYENDPATLYQRYMHRTAGNVAFTEFGVQGPVGLRYLREAAQEEPGVSPEDLEAFDRVVAELMGRPVPGALVSEPALAARLLVGTQRLGSLVFTQAAEAFNMLHHLGLRSLLAANLSIPKMVSEVGRLKKGLPANNRLLTSIETMSGPIGMDMYRLRLPLDAPDDRLIAYSEDHGLVTRFLKGASHLQQKVSFFRGLMAAQHRAVAEQIVLKSVRYIREGGPANDKYLADMGFTREMVQQLRATATNWYSIGPDNRVSGLDVSQLPADLAQQYVQAVHRGVGQIIQQTFVGERGAWLHNDYAQLLLQLRTFGLTATEKQWGRTVSNSGYAKAAGIVLAQAALAAPIHLARVHAQAALMDDKERKAYIEQNTNPGALARASMNYASTSALFGDAWELASAFGAGWAEKTGAVDKDFSETIGVRGGSGGAVGRAIPIVGSIDQAAQVLSGNGSVYQGLKQLPGSNLWFIAPIIGLTKDDD